MTAAWHSSRCQVGGPLDPQDVGVAVSAGQPRCRRRAHERPTCGLPAPVQDVWSPSGPQRLMSVRPLDSNQQPGVLEVVMRFGCLATTDDFCALGLVWHPVGLAEPDHAVARGQPSA